MPLQLRTSKKTLGIPPILARDNREDNTKHIG
jgi:hypothetical protein